MNGFSPGERAYAVVRPEKLVITTPEDDTPDGPEGGGTVESSLYLGTATQIDRRPRQGREDDRAGAER